MVASKFPLAGFVSVPLIGLNLVFTFLMANDCICRSTYLYTSGKTNQIHLTEESPSNVKHRQELTENSGSDENDIASQVRWVCHQQFG